MAQNWPATFPIAGTRYISAFRGDFNDITDAILTSFVGSSDPPVTFPCMFWADTNNGKLKQRNVADTAWIVRGDLEVDYGGCLPKTGGTMTGALNMGGYAITNLPAGSGTAPARYTDLVNYVKADGTTAFTAFPSLPGATNPTLAAQAAHKKYVDETVLGGGSYTGQITMTVAPTLSQHVMRKTDVENLIDTHAHTGAALSGPKVEGSNLKATGISDGSFLRASSSLGQWSTVALGALVIRGERLACLSNSAAVGTWTDYNFGAEIATSAVAVLLRVKARSSSSFGSCYYSFRGDGTSVTTGHTTNPPPYPDDIELTEHLIVPVVSRIMEYKFTFTGTGSTGRTGSVELAGYYNEP